MVAERVIGPYLVPDSGERLVHYCQRLRVVYVLSEILRGHWGPSFAGGSAVYLSQPPVPVAVLLLVILKVCAPSVTLLRPPEISVATEGKPLSSLRFPSLRSAFMELAS